MNAKILIVDDDQDITTMLEDRPQGLRLWHDPRGVTASRPWRKWSRKP